MFCTDVIECVRLPPQSVWKLQLANSSNVDRSPVGAGAEPLPLCFPGDKIFWSATAVSDGALDINPTLAVAVVDRVKTTTPPARVCSALKYNTPWLPALRPQTHEDSPPQKYTHLQWKCQRYWIPPNQESTARCCRSISAKRSAWSAALTK